MGRQADDRRAELAWQVGRALGSLSLVLGIAAVLTAGLSPLLAAAALVLLPAPMFAVMVGTEAVVRRVPAVSLPRPTTASAAVEPSR
jgi:hypothetical protein